MKREKPEKPTADFPLYPHIAGKWAKKIAGKTRYFGPWEDPEGSLETYLREKSDWEAGRNPREKIEATQVVESVGLRLADGLNLFLDSCMDKIKRGELGQRSYDDYKASAEKVLACLGRHQPINDLKPDHWRKLYLSISKGNSQVTIGNQVTRIKVMFNWLLKNRYLDREPHYGSEFTKPAKSAIRRARANSGKKWFSADELQKLLTTDHLVLRAMILLGINCAYGNGDCSQLQFDWVDLEKGWIQYARPKTGVDRRAKLWPETIKAIQTWQEKRPAINNKLIFVTRQGNAWSDPNSCDCAIAKAFQRISRDKEVWIAGRGFYGLRRTFETIAGRSKDQVAVDHIMGHVDQSMAGIYRQEIDDFRLIAVSELVRSWVFSLG
jgi:integrase